VDSSEPALNFLGRREFMAKLFYEQVSLVRELLWKIRTTKSKVSLLFSANLAVSFRRN